MALDYHRTIAQLFDYFYAKKYRAQRHFKLDLDRNKHRAKIDGFVQLLANHFQLPSIGVNYLLDYFAYAFAYWHTKETKRTITLNWIIGKKTFNRWLTRKEGTDYWTEQFLLEFGIDFNAIRHRLAEPDLLSATDQAEELEKTRFKGDAQLYHCLLHTTLYNHKSVHCIVCPTRVMCKKLLQIHSPRLYTARGYESAT